MLKEQSRRDRFLACIPPLPLPALCSTLVKESRDQLRRGKGWRGPRGSPEDGAGVCGYPVTFSIVFLERRGSQAAGGAQCGAAHLHVAAHVGLGGRL